jgi:hypothetical protein
MKHPITYRIKVEKVYRKGNMLLEQFFLEGKSTAAPTKAGAAENASSPKHTKNYMLGLDFLILPLFGRNFNPIGVSQSLENTIISFYINFLFLQEEPKIGVAETSLLTGLINGFE